MKKEYIVPAMKLQTVEADAEMLIVSGGQGQAGDQADIKPMAPENTDATYGNLW